MEPDCVACDCTAIAFFTMAGHALHKPQRPTQNLWTVCHSSDLVFLSENTEENVFLLNYCVHLELPPSDELKIYFL